MKRRLVILLLLCFVGTGWNLKAAEPTDPWKKAQEILENIREPEFNDQEYNVTDFGAVADGTTVNTKAINVAIEMCSSKGGGKVIIPKGEFLTGPVHLKNNVNLVVSENAVLKFSTKTTDYLPLVKTRWEGDDCYNYTPLIFADGQTNIALSGKGTIDGQGSKKDWWFWKGGKSHGWSKGMPSQLLPEGRPLLKKYNDTQVPVEQRQMGEGHYLRPQFINFINCKNILIEDITITNSPFWIIHPLLSENVIVRKVTINSMGPNNDGIDSESCKNVLIEECIFNTGDDCIALKSGRDFDGRRANVPIENVIIRNCHMKNGHGGVAIGSEISGGVKNIFVENCQMDSPELDRAIRLKTNNSRGGVTDGVYVRDVNVGQVNIAVISINSSYHIDREGQGKFPPMVRNVHISNLKAGKADYAIWLQGIEGENCVENISINNCSFDSVNKPAQIDNVRQLRIENVQINGEDFHMVK